MTADIKDWSAVAYGSQMEDGLMDQFKLALSGMGFEVKFKNVKVYRNENGSEVRKSDWDVGITVDAIERIDTFDFLILGSADGDMVPCIKYLQARGKKCFVIGSGISRDLKETADSWTEITEELVES